MSEELKKTDVFILCGGLGTRFRTVDKDIPKVLADFDGEPFLKLLVQYLASQGFERFVLGTGYKADLVKECIQNEFSGSNLEISYSEESEPLGTGGAIKNARKFITTDNFFVLNGDCFMRLPYKEMLSFHVKQRAICSIAAVSVEDSREYGGLKIEEDHLISAFLEKDEREKSQFVNGGIYCFSQKAFDLMPGQEKFSSEYDLFPNLVNKGVFAFKQESALYDIGTPERYSLARQCIVKEMNRAG